MATKKNQNINGYKYYRMTKTIGHKIVDGKKIPIRKHFYGTSKTNAQEKYEYWLLHKDDAQVINSNERLHDLILKFNELLDVDSQYSLGTRKLYIVTCKKHLLDSPFAETPVCDITPQMLQEFYISLAVSKSVMTTLHNYMKKLFVWLSDSGYCDNHVAGIVIPDKPVRKRSDKIITWSADDIELIERELKDDYFFPAIMCALYAGMRISEILGLKWSDIYDDQIHIVRQNYRMNIVPPKAGSSRNVPLHPKIKEALKNHPYRSDWIFCSSTGGLIDYMTVSNALDRAYKKIGIKKKKFHAFRATFCTNLCKAGVPLQVASKLMGHTSVTTTAKFYAFVDEAEKTDAIMRL